MDYLHLGAVTIHTLAMILVVGYYGILGRVILPALRRSLDGPTMATTLAAVERRALPLVVLSVVLFTVTGAYLLLIDEAYAGIGNLTSTWTTLMLVKHLLVIFMVVIAVGLDRLVAMVLDAPDEAARERALGLTGLTAEATTGLGAMVVLLTAAAQLS